MDQDHQPAPTRLLTCGPSPRGTWCSRTYFALLCAGLNAAQAGEQVHFLDFRGDPDECLGGPGSEIGEVLRLAARGRVLVFGLPLAAGISGT